VAPPGARIGLLLRNQSATLLYVTMLALLPDWSIRRIAPDDTPRQPVAAGVALPVQMIVPPLPAGATTARLTLKLFATTTPMSFDALQIPPLLAGPIQLAAPVRSGGPLDALLNTVRRGAAPVRSAEQDDAHTLWATWQVALQIAEGAGAAP
jgi:hypothetical protein